MSKLLPYYLSRAVAAIAIGGMFALTGAPWWQGVGIGILILAGALIAPRLGRYTVDPDRGAAALDRDERGKAIRDAAARNGFAAVLLSLVCASVWFSRIAPGPVPPVTFQALIGLGLAAYWASDLWLRRA